MPTRVPKFPRSSIPKKAAINALRISFDAIEAIRRNKAVYCIAVGGAAYLVSKAIRKSRVLAFDDLGMEAIYEFEVKDMPVTVAVDASGTSVHTTGPAEWEKRIKEFKIPVAVA